MATCSSILAWEIPWTEEPRGLHSMRSQKSWTQLSEQTCKHYELKSIVYFEFALCVVQSMDFGKYRRYTMSSR